MTVRYEPVVEHKIEVSFRSTSTDAQRIKDVMETAALALVEGTSEAASALFTISCEAVVSAAQRERDARAAVGLEE